MPGIPVDGPQGFRSYPFGTLHQGSALVTLDFIRVPPDRHMIKMEWIEQVVREPECEVVQSDGRIPRYSRIEEAGGKFLRVISLADKETVQNAFLIDPLGGRNEGEIFF